MEDEQKDVNVEQKADQEVASEREVTPAEKKKPFETIAGIAGKFKDGVKAAGCGIGKGLGKGIDAIGSGIEKAKQNKELNKFFESKATTLYINAATIYAIKKLDDDKLTFRCADAEKLGAGVEINFDRQVLEITDIDKKNTFNFVYNDKEYDLPCFNARFRIKEKPVIPNTTISHVTNTITLENSTFSGDIQQLGQINNDLTSIENAINNAKVFPFNKGKKEEAQKMFVAFKSAVNNEIPKEQSFFDKFIKTLGVVAQAVVPIAKKLWS